MAEKKRTIYCPDCDRNLDRRRFMTTMGGAAVVASVLPQFAGSPASLAAPSVLFY